MASLPIVFVHLATCGVLATVAAGSGSQQLPGLRQAASVTRDTRGTAHIRAQNERDLFYLHGWIQAEDRLWHMDFLRRQASGTLAEMLGPEVLSIDVDLRTLGLRRAAERSWSVLSPRAQAAVDAFSDGVNAWTDANPLPPEYGALELTRIEPWDPLDSLAILELIGFGLAFTLDIDATVALVSYVQAGSVLGFDGGALFTEDLWRSAPFDLRATVPDALGTAPLTANFAGLDWKSDLAARASFLRPEALELGQDYMRRLRDNPYLRNLFDKERRAGSNEWVIAPAKSRTGASLLANDPHLSASLPAVFYSVHLTGGTLDVQGETFPGLPVVIVGHNKYVTWGATTSSLDVTDTYQEQLVPDPTSPSGLSSLYMGNLEPVIPIPESYSMNRFDGVPDNIVPVPPTLGLPPVTLILPRRNQGPIVSLDPGSGVALSVQYAGFAGTRELDCFLALNEARNFDEFRMGLQYFDVGSQNIAYCDVKGKIAYFTTAEAPIREDLQNSTVHGLPPRFIRDGQGGNEWLAVQNPQPGQALPYEILTADEMPHFVDPPVGWFENANNDPLGVTFDNDPYNQVRPGGGLFYLDSLYDSGLRAARVHRLCKDVFDANAKMSTLRMREIQDDTVARDAEVFVPYLVQALANAQAPAASPLLAALAAEPRIVEAAHRLLHWDFTHPTGIPEGWDAGDVAGQLSPPSAAEVETSIAATLFNVWRAYAVRNIIDAPLAPYGLPLADGELRALRHLLDTFDTGLGVGASGIDFFAVAGIGDPYERRDYLLLSSLADTLDALASAAFDAAFHGSTQQSDYRWGYLHRIVFAHPLGEPYTVPSAAGPIPPPLPGLAGLPVDGGYGIDAAFFASRAYDADAYMFSAGPARRVVMEGRPKGMHGTYVIPGGTNGEFFSPFYVNLLPYWLTNEAETLLFKLRDILDNGGTTTHYEP
jgi:penicillin amidase